MCTPLHSLGLVRSRLLSPAPTPAACASFCLDQHQGLADSASHPQRLAFGIVDVVGAAPLSVLNLTFASLPVSFLLLFTVFE